jgi:hypothetical protein
MSELLSPEMLGVFATIISFVVGIIVRHPSYQKAKSTVSYSKEFLTKLDDALYDDKITEDEFRAIFDTGKKIMDRTS